MGVVYKAEDTKLQRQKRFTRFSWPHLSLIGLLLAGGEVGWKWNWEDSTALNRSLLTSMDCISVRGG